MSTTIYATFAETENAEKAAGALLDYGVRNEDLTLVKGHDDPATVAHNLDATQVSSSQPVEPRQIEAAPPIPGTSLDAAEKLGNSGYATAYDPDVNVGKYDNYEDLANNLEDNYDPEKAAKAGITTTTPADAGSGALKGAGIGLGVGALAALAAIFIPGLGLVYGGGALATAIAGWAGTTGAGAIAGAVTGYLKDQGMDSEMAHRYGMVLGDKGAMISVVSPSGNVDESQIRSVLDKYGATNVSNFARTGSGGYVA